MEYVIIGNSTAAVGCIEGIRSVDPEGAITVVASEPYHTYSRPLISYLLEGKTDGERMKYRPDSYYNEMAVKPKLGIKAVKLMPEEHKVVLEDGEELPYGKLLVATGSTPLSHLLRAWIPWRRSSPSCPWTTPWPWRLP